MSNMTTTQGAFDSILKAVEFNKLSTADQESFLEELNSLVFRGAVIRMLERMDESTRATWHDLISNGASEATLQRFLERRAPKAELALAETVEGLASDILAVTSN